MSALLQSQHGNFFTKKDHEMWKLLIESQTEILHDKATEIFFDNLKVFNLPKEQIPNINDISEKMYYTTKWKATPVEGLVGYNQYFSMLKKRQFPVAMFIRDNKQRGLCKDPDIFHEIFGHCTMLFSADYAEFLFEYAKFALTVPLEDRPLYARLMWFSTETALIKHHDTIRIFGSSLISSATEAIYSLTNQEVIRKPFDIVSIFREPYRADLLQKVYYVLENTNQIYNLIDNVDDLFRGIKLARSLGEYPALFPISNNKYVNINAI